MQFKVGQPVWAIGPKTGKWRPSVVASGLMLVRDFHTNERYMGHLIELVSDDLSPSRLPWISPPSLLRPRDEGQFEPATDFDWRKLTAPEDLRV